ncbi:carbohydrate esterase family 16 protein [Lojkania enalia]|uniref:Carbohydrate esterase family 16 protein n=1 Tax=Lojkania enalia TaxID=147567 RepID=A0A9P4N5X7_9PLEO|nr:carbohydrate esterase family 16 protein [Didymosphaeria enalia]
MVYFITYLVAFLVLVLGSFPSFSQATNFFITFGDSYSQTGFDVSSSKPSSANPLGNPAYPGYTTSGGPNWIGYLVKDYNASALYSFNFAYGGATVNASLVKPYQPTVKSLIDQVGQFGRSIANKPSYAPWTAENSLFAIWMGVNDVGNSYSNPNEAQLIIQIFNSYFSQIEILFNAGARNFALLSVPPIHKTPLVMRQSKAAQELEASVIEQFNTALADRTSKFLGSHPGAKVVIVNTRTPFDAAINDPTKYGATNAICYNSNGKTCLWHDDYHPGLEIHRLVAEAVVQSWDGSFFRVIPFGGA